MALSVRWGGGFGRFLFLKAVLAMPHSKDFCNFTILVKTVFNYYQPLCPVPQNVNMLGLQTIRLFQLAKWRRTSPYPIFSYSICCNSFGKIWWSLYVRYGWNAIVLEDPISQIDNNWKLFLTKTVWLQRFFDWGVARPIALQMKLSKTDPPTIVPF